MTQIEANKLVTVTKNISNIQTLIGDLLMPVTAMTTKYGCTQQQAVNMKLKAEDYLTKYGCMTLDSSVKAIRQLATNITETNSINQNITSNEYQ